MNSIKLLRFIENLLIESLPVDLGYNKKNEITRLLFEICSISDKSPTEILIDIGFNNIPIDQKGGIFHKLKKKLLLLRYPSYTSGCNPHLYPLKINEKDQETKSWGFRLDPRYVLIEDSVKDKKWVEQFVSQFPQATIKSIKTFKEGVGSFPRENQVERYNERRGNIFLVRNKDAFLKICPCTKGAHRCGYWVLNIGFGCPIDCSYCFLQLYSNTPGLVLPANIDDYFTYIMDFDKKVSTRTRIGTGEFTDSLALDKYTGYSSLLIPFFNKTKNLVLELKTKAADIDTVLSLDPHENIVLSWSVNPEKIVQLYEKGGATIEERIIAAERAAARGYNIGFHFDPVIYSPKWENEYRSLLESIFSSELIRRKTVWISLGTLRYAPGLKQIAEQRFENNLIYYSGDFFEDDNGKMRYPVECRTDIYKRMISWIKGYDTGAWIYLCMEPKEVCEKVMIQDIYCNKKSF